MDDRELLGLAAKAAGLNAQYSDNFGDFSIGEPYSRDEVRWNPLTDDGDALRLAVRLQLSICNEHLNAGVAYCSTGDHSDYPCVQSRSNESFIVESDYGATRMAIVLAAAEIGKLL